MSKKFPESTTGGDLYILLVGISLVNREPLTAVELAQIALGAGWSTTSCSLRREVENVREVINKRIREGDRCWVKTTVTRLDLAGCRRQSWLAYQYVH